MAEEIKEAAEMKETKKEISKKKKFMVFGAFTLVIMIILFLVIKFYLITNLLLGNDILVTLSSNNENLFLEHNEVTIIKFNIYVVTNPFCNAKCTSEFIDLSTGNMIDNETFTLTPPNFKLKQYFLNSTKPGRGQDLFEFAVNCKSTKTILCNTEGKPNIRTILVTMNYDLNKEEKKLSQDSQDKISLFVEQSDYLASNLNEFLSISGRINSTLEMDDLKSEISSLMLEKENIQKNAYSLKDLMDLQDYSSLQEELAQTEMEFNAFTGKFDEINKTFSLQISSYNEMIDNLTEMQKNLDDFKKINVTNTTSAMINKVINDFNNLSAQFMQRNMLPVKEALTSSLADKVSEVKLKIYNETNTSDISLCCYADEKINDFKADKATINVPVYHPAKMSFGQAGSVCCLLNNCAECCNDTCSDKKELFPVIFLHGHDFSKKISSDHSLNFFENIQKNLENDRYVNAGSIIPGFQNITQKGIWGRMNAPISLKASYYFDIYNDLKEGKIIQTKADSLDSYAVRLRDIINLVKYKTNRNKVILVTHSMGGLVARRYVQIFGYNDIDKLIMVATPNHGIDNSILKYCSLFGEKLECRDMDKESLFINRIFTGEIPAIPIYNIVGSGCIMDGEDGDGIVKATSAYLEYARNFYINGSCSTLGYLHGDIIDYPETYEIIKKALKE